MNLRTAALLTSLLLLAGACTPYSVAHTGRTVPRGDRSASYLLSVVPGGARYETDSMTSTHAIPGFDVEQRIGLDERSDIGLRVNAMTGLIASYKRRIHGTNDPADAATALLVGAGFVNLAQHAHGEVTLIHSAGEGGQLTPYAGIRALQVIPLSSTAVSDKPTIGVFGGTRLGGRTGGLSFELGVFYDRSALGLRRNDLVIVPSISFHTAELTGLLR